ncbi:hypothetical protein Celaphus_00013702 [Cervus elaphus hippelaphus]|uniref:Uncharacterized protein n=1 Tax=Cervus elaphus hippelaphus TaxID=46360 RepID=A0A212CCA0_CEREH|nr:hypothetical protein Celaphus_00013702 [Cervus elaphus hippelaphus]
MALAPSSVEFQRKEDTVPNNKTSVATLTTDWLLRKGTWALRNFRGGASARAGAAHTSALPAPGPRRDRPWATTGASVPAWLVLPPEAARSRLPPPPRPDLTGKQFRRAAAAVTHRPARIPAIGPSWWRPARADGAAGEAAETQGPAARCGLVSAAIQERHPELGIREGLHPLPVPGLCASQGPSALHFCWVFSATLES